MTRSGVVGIGLLSLLGLLVPVPAEAYCHGGVSNAPCEPGSLRTLSVPGTYTTIQAALDISIPGDLIEVAAGTYAGFTVTRAGTSIRPILIRPVAGVRPIIGSVVFSGTPLAKWVLLQGFEIQGTTHGIELIKTTNTTIRDNYIHDTGGQGIMCAGCRHVLIEKNDIARSGVGQAIPAQYHGIYNGYWSGTEVRYVSLLDNTLREHAGAGLHSYHPTVSPERYGYVVGNVFLNNTHDVTLGKTRDGTFIDNLIVHESHPPTGDTTGSFGSTSSPFWIENITNVSFSGTIVVNRMNGPTDFVVMQAGNAPTFSGSTWDLLSEPQQWLWMGTVYTDFATEWTAITGQD